MKFPALLRSRRSLGWLAFLLVAVSLSGCAALGTPDDPNQPIPPARPSPFSDAASTGAAISY